MGRLIDADVLREEIYSWGMNDYEPSDFTDAIDDAPTIDAISKADYEARLKADMVAMLTEIQLEIEEKEFLESSCSFMDNTEEKNYAVYTDDISEIIQQKIDALKADGSEDKE